MLPMAVGAGGDYLTGKPTKHSETNRDVIRKFLDMDIKFIKDENEKQEIYRVEIGK
jgi:RNA 3'-terminal phosphate cyclase (ATP)